MRITIKDVAKVAGVSPATVSFVLNDTRRVRPETRTRIEEAIRRLGYRPDGLARSLVTGRSLAIGVVLPNLGNPSMVETVHGAEEVARSQGYSLLLSSTYEDPDRQIDSYRRLLERRVDGILLWTRRPSAELEGLIAVGPPAVCVGTRLTGERVAVVFPDVREAARQAARHLASLGYRRMAMLAGPLGAEHGVRLHEGFVHGLAEAGLDLPAEMVMSAGGQFETGYEAARELLACEPRPDAVFAYNDLVAAGALMACRELQIRVPGDMGLVACDDTIIARLLNPPLTSIHIPLRQLGATAIELLFALIRGEDLETRDVGMACSLVVRQSSMAGSL